MSAPLADRFAHSFARTGRSRIYGPPRRPNDHMLKDIGISADEFGLLRKR